jgi:hypothetical protein
MLCGPIHNLRTAHQSHWVFNDLRQLEMVTRRDLHLRLVSGWSDISPGTQLRHDGSFSLLEYQVIYQYGFVVKLIKLTFSSFSGQHHSSEKNTCSTATTELKILSTTLCRNSFVCNCVMSSPKPFNK